jgi:hypothetical protein
VVKKAPLKGCSCEKKVERQKSKKGTTKEMFLNIPKFFSFLFTASDKREHERGSQSK